MASHRVDRAVMLTEAIAKNWLSSPFRAVTEGPGLMASPMGLGVQRSPAVGAEYPYPWLQCGKSIPAAVPGEIRKIAHLSRKIGK